ncbi:MAG: hypothetical protein ACM3VT_12550 [Solirubrobacterales bacterium]
MSLMKWMRKNNKKLMAVVVIVLMIAFIGGQAFSYLMRGSGGANAAVAYYGHKHKISHNDRITAENELKLLEELGAPSLLRRQDLRGLLLAELLFAQSRDSAGLMDMARQMIQRNQYHISEKQLNDMYATRAGVPGDIYWILLRDEAQSVGIYVSNQEVGGLLGRIIPQMFDGATYSQLMRNWVNRYGMPEETILATYGKLIAVLQYAQVISSMEDVTTSQIRHLADNEAGSLDAEYVQLEASAFADKQQTPAEDALAQQFNQYKANIPGAASESNPFGFGYRLPNRVQFEYIAVKLSDVAAIIKPPTNEDAELYYQQNRARQFTQQVPSDPNDPNSPQIDKVRSFAEVADEIMSQLKRQRITTKAEQILQDARNIADANLPRTGSDGNEPPIQILKEKAGNYARIAQDLSAKFSLPLHNGTTGLLSAVDMRNDRYLRRMSLMTYGTNPVPLSMVLFSLKVFGEDATLLQSASPAMMFASVGPAKDPSSATASDVSSQIMLIARVVDAEPSMPPANIDVSYSTRTLDLGDPAAQQNKTFFVKEQVVKDLRDLAAWPTVGAKATELAAAAAKDGWDAAVNQLNKQTKADPNDPNLFRVDRRRNVQRISEADLEVLAAQLSNNPSGKVYLAEANVESEFSNRLYSLAPADPNAVSQTQIMEFKPGRSYYVIKSLKLTPLYQEQFQKMKGMVTAREEYGQSQSLAVVHLNPENIIKRMNFRWAKPAVESTKDEAKKESKDAA